MGAAESMAKDSGKIVALPAIVDLDALDLIRDELIDAVESGPVRVDGKAVERVSTNALFMLMSAAETARRNNFGFRSFRTERVVPGRRRAAWSRRPVRTRLWKDYNSMRVLTVDDSRTILAMLHHTLSNAGFEVLQAEDGQKGLDVLKNESVDVVITDINMPVMDGIEFIKNVRASGMHNSLPILILTTETSQDKRDQGRAAGGTGWIVKPFDPEKLISVIHRVVH